MKGSKPDDWLPDGLGWECFHCGEYFISDHEGRKAARLHFGEIPECVPACAISELEIRQIRYNEKRVRNARKLIAKAKGLMHGKGCDRAIKWLREADGLLFDTLIP